MPKWLPTKKNCQLRISSPIIFLLCLVGFVQFFASYGQYNYDHIPREQLIEIIYFHTNPKLQPNTKIFNCNYEGIIQNRRSFKVWDMQKYYERLSLDGIADGTYSPENCNALLSVAVLLTYRNRLTDLYGFISYIHNFLRKQEIHYRIYVIEQADYKPFNRGHLFNIGAKQAIADGYPCLILHDLDLYPLDVGNLYACLHQPRYMIASNNLFSYLFTNDFLVGGAFAIRADQYISINGFSNKFEGSGGEDEDFAERIAAGNLKALRLPWEMSRYKMLTHPQQQMNKDHRRIMAENKIDRNKDGLNSAEYATKNVKRTRLFTLIAVEL